MWSDFRARLAKAATIAGIVGIIVVSASGCTKKSGDANDPKNRLNDYITKSFNVKSLADRNTLASFLIGQAKTRLYAWSDEQFRAAFLESKRSSPNLKWVEVKNASPDEVNITYDLSYIDQGRGHDAKVTNRKLAQMVRQNGQWFIRDVTNIKEMVEYRNELSLP